MNYLKLFLFICCLPLAHADDRDAAAVQGEQLYYDFGCYSCHGFNATMRVPLVGDTSGIMSSEALFLNYLRLRADQNPINPNNSMPNYSAATLSDEQARKIYSYIRSIDDDPPEVADIAVMQKMLDDAGRDKPDQND
jgi:mono/diheme cytochrome c family protein